MLRKVISYFNKEIGFYTVLRLVENTENSNIVESCKRYLQTAPNDQVVACVGHEIRLIGEFDDEKDSPMVPYEDPISVCDCDDILKLRFPQIYEQRKSND